MKHEFSSLNALAQLQAAAQALGATCTAAQLEALTDYATWAGPAAARIGLTNYRTTQDFISGLVCPTLALLTPSVAPHLASPALDFGAGSGAVGFTLAILRPDLEIVLADRRKRVVDFAELCRARLGVRNSRGLLADLSVPPASDDGLIPLVLMRAYGPPEPALGQALAWLTPAGTIALWHQAQSLSVPPALDRLLTTPTTLPGLSLTLYRRNTGS